MILVPYLLLMVFYCLQGATDAIMYSKRGADALALNEHELLVTQRSITILLVASGFFVDPIEWGILLLAAAFSFSFFHNWVYGYTKAKIWGTKTTLLQDMMYVSKTDTSRYNFDFPSRLVFLIIGIAFIVADLILLG